MDKIKKELEKYSNIDGTEIGEYCWYLLGLDSYTPYIGDEFRIAIEKEMKRMLDNFKRHSRIVERIETKTLTIRELEWDND